MEKELIYSVEDDDNIRDLIKYTVEEAGFNIECFSNGKDMLEALKNNIPSLILLDIMLPDMEGTDILKIIRIQSVLYGTVSGIPSPGAVGVTEGGFIEIFKTVFPKNSINGAMILNRGINFYLLIVISAVITMTNAIKFQKMEEKNTENNEEISWKKQKNNI